MSASIIIPKQQSQQQDDLDCAFRKRFCSTSMSSVDSLSDLGSEQAMSECDTPLLTYSPKISYPDTPKWELEKGSKLDTFDLDELPPPQKSCTIGYPEWVDEVVDWNKCYETDEEKMALAIEMSRQNVRRGTGGPFGSAIFEIGTGRLVSVGMNRVVPLSNSCLHGEMVAFMMAQARKQTFSLSGRDHELFTSAEPCAMCLGATLWSGVKRMVSAATGIDVRAIGFDEGPVFRESFKYLEGCGIEIVRQVLREEAKQVLKEYSEIGIIYNGKP
eukprot:NODE_4070_length_1235_cov_49.658273_g3432_i1.p1 GENE.NODE_4070_length_1235_cov_49.658273_g3432_i1~~NODE_4070_length_1235_cov_49.658273_g3432_i1.p1  ORF type:complete len:293 (-),score=65.39 NODE_4070_length_1235_cov_49.658273_g3432_i1:355-1173(-)